MTTAETSTGSRNIRIGPDRLNGLQAALRMFDFSLGQMLWSRRTVFMALVVGGPVVLALILRLLLTVDLPGVRVDLGGTVRGESVFGTVIWLLYLRFIAPVLGVFYGTALLADEIEDKTLTFLFTRPVRRGAVVIGKYMAYLVCTGLVVLPSVVLVYFLVVPLGGGSIARTFPALLTDLGLLALGLAAYGGLFAFIGAWFRRPLVVGLVFAFGWEQVALAVPGYLRRGTVAYYLQGLVPHAMPESGVIEMLQGLFRDAPSVVTSVACLAGIAAGFVLLAAWLTEYREYVLSD